MAHDPSHEHHANVDHTAMGIEKEHPTWSTYWKVATILTLITGVMIFQRVEKNFVDSHGQSEVAFAFCHLLGGVRLMPRLKTELDAIKLYRYYVRLERHKVGDAADLGIGVTIRPCR